MIQQGRLIEREQYKLRRMEKLERGDKHRIEGQGQLLLWKWRGKLNEGFPLSAISIALMKFYESR